MKPHGWRPAEALATVIPGGQYAGRRLVDVPLEDTEWTWGYLGYASRKYGTMLVPYGTITPAEAARVRDAANVILDAIAAVETKATT